MLARVREHLKFHYAAYLAALTLTLIVSGPLLVFPTLAGEAYRGINIAHFDRLDEHFYLSRAREVLDGHNLGNPLLNDGKNQSDTYFNYAEKVLLRPVRWLGLAGQTNVVTLYNFYNLLGVFLLALLVYFLIWQLSASRLLSLTSVIFALGGYHLVYSGSFFYNDFNFYGRAMYPYLSSILFFAYLNLLVATLDGRGRRWLISAGLVFGLIFYISFYGWTYGLSLNLILATLFLLRKDFSNFKKVALISVVGVLIGAYNLTKLALFFGSAAGRDFSRFFGALPSHRPVGSGLGLVALGLFLVFFFLKRDDRRRDLLLSFILTGWLVLNQQILTGTVLQLGHYYWYFIVPVVILVVLYLVWRLISGFHHRRLVFVGLSLFIIVHAVLGQYWSFFTTFQAKLYEQSYEPLIEVLSKDHRPAVILAPLNRLGLLFTIYTDHDLFWNSAAVWSYNQPERFLDVFKVYAYLDKKFRLDPAAFLNNPANGDRTEMAIYNNIKKIQPDFNPGSFSAEFQKVNTSTQIKKILQRYGVGYLVWDKTIYPNWDLGGLGVVEVARSGNVHLYSL